VSEELIIRCAAPTLAGLKTGSLFSCRFDSLHQLHREIRDVNRRVAGKGLRLLPLRVTDDTALLYLYRPLYLQRDLENDEARKLLAETGYDDLRPGRCLPHLLQRFRGGGDFPHEVGLFLSYPPEDVRGFIRNKGRHCKCAGCWKVYGDPEQARRRFEGYHRCTEDCCRQYAMGVSLDELLVSVS
jgi:hypothetical protein